MTLMPLSFLLGVYVDKKRHNVYEIKITKNALHLYLFASLPRELLSLRNNIQRGKSGSLPPTSS
jgi:hypothetical protein